MTNTKILTETNNLAITAYLFRSPKEGYENGCVADDTEGPDDDHVGSGKVVHCLRNVGVLSVAPVVGVHH